MVKCEGCQKEITKLESDYYFGECWECFIKDDMNIVKTYGEVIFVEGESKEIKFNNVDELFALIDKVKKATGLNPIVVGDVDKLKGVD